MPDRSPEEQLIKYLADAHSIEEQALTQLRRAPAIAGAEPLATIFREHLEETEEQERKVRARLEAHGAEPSKLKDLAGKAGGIGMVLFARVQPDSPGKLTAHAFSYEHLEWAAYELLFRAASAVGDSETAEVAREIGGQEREMAERLAGAFDAAVDASLEELGRDDLNKQLVKYLADAHAIEQQALQLLETAPELVEDEGLARGFSEHLAETRGHEQRVRERLEQRDGRPSRIKDAALRIGGMNLGGFFGAQPDTTAKLAGFSFAFEHLEVAAYELLKRVARRAGDEETVQMAEEILAEEREAARRIAASWDRTMALDLAEQTG